MTEETHSPTDDDPTGGHDPKALADAARKMGVKTSDDSAASSPSKDDDDPTGGHDEKALTDAARKMGVKP